LAAIAGIVVSAQRWPGNFTSLSMVVLAVAVVASELLAVELAGGAGLSLTYPLLVCAAVLVGPTSAGALAALSTLPFLFHKPRMSGTRLLGNLGQLVLTALVPAWLYLALGGRLMAAAPLSDLGLSGQLAPLVVAATAGVAVNGVLFGVGYALVRNVTLAEAWRLAVSWAITSQIALGFTGLAIAQVMRNEGPLGFALFVVPLLVARQTYRRYLSLRETYADTVRSLVAALEAKDPYTKGHSIRVARVTVSVARRMGFEDVEVERMEYAAVVPCCRSRAPSPTRSSTGFESIPTSRQGSSSRSPSSRMCGPSSETTMSGWTVSATDVDLRARRCRWQLACLRWLTASMR
jgi:hypothetical protein